MSSIALSVSFSILSVNCSVVTSFGPDSNILLSSLPGRASIMLISFSISFSSSVAPIVVNESTKRPSSGLLLSTSNPNIFLTALVKSSAAVLMADSKYTARAPAANASPVEAASGNRLFVLLAAGDAGVLSGAPSIWNSSDCLFF